VTTALRSQYLTVRAVARHMVRRGSGAILTVTGYGPPFPELGGTAVAWQTVESLYRQWACELGPAGVRVAWLRTGGFAESVAGAAAYDSVHQVVDGRLVPLSEVVDDAAAAERLAALERETMLGRLPSLVDAGAAAVFLVSDHGGAVTASAVNLTSGAVAD
jgi:3-oxoacyl-[acyl-carrier protein] reductase